MPWTAQLPDTPAPIAFGSDRRGTTDAEEERGLDLPIHIFPLFENALRAEAGRSLDEHRRRIGGLWSRFSEVAATNPHAWLRSARTVEEVITPTPQNRMIAYPYTKLLTANMQVDQGAALIMCSAAAAEAAGVPRDRWVFPLSRGRRRRPLVPVPPARLPLVAGDPPGRLLVLWPWLGWPSMTSPTSTSTRASRRQWR